MEKQFDMLKQTRENILAFTSGLSIEELNFIPDNYNNNIIWNIGHLIAAEQSLFYRLSEIPFTVHLEFIDRYKKGTRPEKYIGAEEWKFIQDTLLSSVETTRNNYQNNVFNYYKQYETSYGVMLNSIEDAIAFENVHEGMHFGFVKALHKSMHKKTV